MENELLLLVGASSSHSGVDIPAPPGSKLIAVHDGEITFREFLGAGGYTITLSFDNYKLNKDKLLAVLVLKLFMVWKETNIMMHKVILLMELQLGPHLHLGIRIDGKYVNPLNYF